MIKICEIEKGSFADKSCEDCGHNEFRSNIEKDRVVIRCAKCGLMAYKMTPTPAIERLER